MLERLEGPYRFTVFCLGYFVGDSVELNSAKRNAHRKDAAYSSGKLFSKKSEIEHRIDLKVWELKNLESRLAQMEFVLNFRVWK